MKIRYRLGAEGNVIKKHVLVLQIYKRIPEGQPDSYGGSGRPAIDMWVDATVEDLSELMGEGK